VEGKKAYKSRTWRSARSGPQHAVTRPLQGKMVWGKARGPSGARLPEPGGAGLCGVVGPRVGRVSSAPLRSGDDVGRISWLVAIQDGAHSEGGYRVITDTPRRTVT